MQKTRWVCARLVAAIAVGAGLFGCVVVGGVALAQENAGPPGSAFEGLWQGVDRADGSELQVSIVQAAHVPVNVTSVELSLRSRGEVLVLGLDPEIFVHRVGN